MTRVPAGRLAEARRVLSRVGLLLVSDPDLPSLATIVAGEPVRGSWWGHPAGHAIYAALGALLDDPDVAAVKLVRGKETLLHRNLWPALLSVGTSGEPWQTRGLSATARRLLQRVRRAGSLRLDRGPGAGRPLNDAARDLERRLLVAGGQVHTESGAHAKVLETWDRWARHTRVRAGLPPVADARSVLEEAVRSSSPRPAGQACLPWGGGRLPAP
ncbi:MAG: hypothetical protein L0216_07420 [Planctomycetales bacterium]|nr:hypothetical protein [Planctomycetales bacterium]